MFRFNIILLISLCVVASVRADQCVEAEASTTCPAKFTATQSTTSHNAPASRAIDGNENPEWKGKSCTHTPSTTAPWWSVDFGCTKTVDTVEIVNRKDCCADRLADFDVYVTHGPISKCEPKKDQRCAEQVGPMGAKKTFKCPANLRGRYLTIRLRGPKRILTLCEVKPTFLCEAGKPGSCSTKFTATQMATSHNAPASRALDGNKNPNWKGGSCTHTHAVTAPWWTVDFGCAKTVKGLKIYNRQDCCAERLANFDIYVHQNPASECALSEATRCAFQAGAMGKEKTFTCANQLVGRYLTIRLRGTKRILTLCEVVPIFA